MSVYIVQFPHPGSEHAPGNSSRMEWNAGPHRRKFLRSPGRYVDTTGAIGDADLVFWGEWEGASRVVRRWRPDGGLPVFLHEPLLAQPPGGFRQNTDPWVFGECFLYSNCKQLTPKQNPSALQALTRGSVILFGSQLAGEFVLDTAFVVADAILFTPADADSLDLDQAFRISTVQSLMTNHRSRDGHFTLFRGATADDPVEGMFSFVPCLAVPRGEDQRFGRPAISLPGHINPASKQAPSGAKSPLEVARVRNLWARVREQVLRAGNVLGVSFATPLQAH